MNRCERIKCRWLMRAGVVVFLFSELRQVKENLRVAMSSLWSSYSEGIGPCGLGCQVTLEGSIII